MTSQQPLIYTQLSAIMHDISAIGKTQKGFGFMYRGIDNIYNELHPILARHQVVTVPKVLEERSEEKTSGKGGILIYRILKIEYTFYAEDGSFVQAVTIGEGMDSGDKASNKAMAVAHKYALMQVFCIPTDDPKDPEIDHHEIVKAEPKDDTMSKTYQGTGEQKAYLMKLCKSKGITDHTMMGKINAKLKMQEYKMSELLQIIPELFKEISNGDK